MPPVFQSEGLTRSVGDGRILFGDLKLSIHEGDKIGLVAKNGTGKTSLLRIIAGVDAPDSGSMTFRNGVRVGYLAQTPDVPRGMSALDACVAMVGSRDVHDDEASLRLECEKMLGKLGLTDIQADTGSLSGGQRKRLAMAALLVSQPDFLILDEPTNHLDIPAIEWLEKYLQRTNATLLMVTHDRYFLDRICRRIWELDNEQIFDYEGDYAYYLRRRQERIEALGAELDKVRNTLRREQEWMSRQPQARAGKAKYRIDAFYDLKERSQVNLREKNVDLSNMKSSRIGSKIIEAQAVSKRYGDKVILDDFTYTFARGEKIGIVGGNGVGKTTLMRILQGLEPMDKGNIEVGTTIRFGYYTQERNLELDGSKRV
ncbi:MAG: ABC-F family ATP-binding cassette domain-containing protein, partial [Muribaculaceae bacterium]|nr:ABC-F family ATP-binding cassette domain-containing protein [Muribaculaceae bacterium]